MPLTIGGGIRACVVPSASLRLCVSGDTPWSATADQRFGIDRLRLSFGVDSQLPTANCQLSAFVADRLTRRPSTVRYSDPDGVEHSAVEVAGEYFRYVHSELGCACKRMHPHCTHGHSSPPGALTGAGRAQTRSRSGRTPSTPPSSTTRAAESRTEGAACGPDRTLAYCESSSVLRVL